MSELMKFIDARLDPQQAAARLMEVIEDGVPPQVVQRAREIVEDVRRRGDEAVVEYTRRFDWPEATVKDLVVSEDEIAAAYEQVDERWLRALRKAKENLFRYHERQAPRSWLQDFGGILLGQRVRAIGSVGIHVPGFAAPLPSSVLHCAIPAQVAGVGRIAVVTPPRRDGSVHPTVLVAASECGVSEVYKMGGAQAVAALAFGTAVVPPVDKIVGPGNAYVVEAKRAVFGKVGIDNLAGPSESAIIADGSASPDLVAADLLTQAEHSGDNLVALLTPEESLIDAVVGRLTDLLEQLDRAQLIEQSLADFGAMVLVESLQQAADLVNRLAPEHLQLMVAEPLELLGQIEAAGAIFIGPHSPVPLGDYIAGPSHVLPTNRAARFSSGLGVGDFVVASSVIWSSPRATAAMAPDAIALAEAEGLTAHAEALRLRIEGSGVADGNAAE